MMILSILVIESEPSLLTYLTSYLDDRHYDYFVVPNDVQGLKIIRQYRVDIVLISLHLDSENELAMLVRLHTHEPELPIILLGTDDTSTIAVTALKLGAADYLSRDCNEEEVVRIMQQAVAAKTKAREPCRLQQHAGSTTLLPYVIGSNPQMREAFAMVARVAQADTTSVLIVGETGTGKDVVAKAIHEQSARASGPFHSLFCNAIPSTLMESEMFGYERHAFTGARERKPGLLELAQGGTLFLNEIGELPLDMQIKLLDVLDRHSFFRVGGKKEIKLNVRFVLATNRDLEQASKSGTFRSDLFFRFAVVTISLPPLRERTEDIPLYVSHFIELFNSKLGNHVEGVASEAQPFLQAYSWPGNVRELKNVIEHAMIFCDGNELQRGHFPPQIVESTATPTAEFSTSWEHWLQMQPAPPASLEMVVERISRKLMCDALERTNYNFARAAGLLKLSTDQLRYQMRKQGIDSRKEKHSL
jgi:DNA-binding NtrC family response regulator